MSTTATVMATVWAVQAILSSLTSLDLTGYLFPPSASVANGTSFDYVIVGGGSAGCVIANRLTENETVSVLLIEAGGDPPMESLLSGLFVYQPNSSYDWNLFSLSNDGSAPYHINESTALTQGKMLGGSSSLDHLLYVKGNPHDYEAWATAANDSSWNWDGLYNYFQKAEKLQDAAVLNSSYADNYGTSGYRVLKRDPYDELLPLLAAFEEMGNTIALDLNGNDTLGYAQSIYAIDKLRQTVALTYLGQIKNRTNLYVLKNTEVTEILFNGTTAVGVKAEASDGSTVVYGASKEVIVSAGAFGSPKLLMLSGIGPQEHLESLGIEVKANLSGVGQNLMDHTSVPVIHTLEASNATASSVNPTLFPAPCFVGYKAMNQSQSYPDYQAIGLLMPHDSTATVALCASSFTYKESVCDAIYNASVGRNILYTVLNMAQPKSRGQVWLASAAASDAVLVRHGLLSDSSDLASLARYLADYAAVVNSTYFQSVGSQLVDLGLAECAALQRWSSDYWQCYARYAVATTMHWSGTCAMGSVVDARLRVRGLRALRVADSSAMPGLISGNIQSAVIALAEKASDLIKEDNCL